MLHMVQFPPEPTRAVQEPHWESGTSGSLNLRSGSCSTCPGHVGFSLANLAQATVDTRTYRDLKSLQRTDAPRLMLTTSQLQLHLLSFDRHSIQLYPGCRALPVMISFAGGLWHPRDLHYTTLSANERVKSRTTLSPFFTKFSSR